MALPDYRAGLVEIRYHHIDEDISNISQRNQHMIQVREGRTYDRPTYALSYKSRGEKKTEIFSSLQKRIIKSFATRVCEEGGVHPTASVVLWVDKVYTKNTPRGQFPGARWYMHGLLPYTRFNCVRIDDYPHRQPSNYSGWMRMEAAVAEKVGHLITYDRHFRCDNHLVQYRVRMTDPAELLREACKQISEAEERYILTGYFYRQADQQSLRNLLHPEDVCSRPQTIQLEEWNTLSHICGWSESSCLGGHTFAKTWRGKVEWTVVASAGRYCFASAPLSGGLRVIVDLGNNRVTDRDCIHVYAVMISAMSNNNFETTYKNHDRVQKGRDSFEIAIETEYDLHLNFSKGQSS